MSWILVTKYIWKKIKLTSVKFKFSKTSQQESKRPAINAISDRLFFLARSSSPPPCLLNMSRGQLRSDKFFGGSGADKIIFTEFVQASLLTGYLWPTLGSIYDQDARFGFYLSSLHKTRHADSHLFNLSMW